MDEVPQICPNYSRLAIGWKPGLPEAVLTRIRCKKWDCEYCAAINKRQWQKRLIEGIKVLGGAWSFWTLTHDLADDTDYVSQRQHLSKCANRLNARIKRKVARAPAYCRVIEIGTQGTMRMHHHMLLNVDCWPYLELQHRNGQEYSMAMGWLMDIITSGYGRIADIRPVTDHVADRPLEEQAIYAASYVSKYMAKLDKDNPYPAYTRRFNVSRNWPEVGHEDGFASGLTWDTFQALNVVIMSGYWGRGLHVRDVDRDERITIDEMSNDRDGLWIDPLRYGGDQPFTVGGQLTIGAE
jgi:hypothetical protein